MSRSLSDALGLICQSSSTTDDISNLRDNLELSSTRSPPPKVVRRDSEPANFFSSSKGSSSKTTRYEDVLIESTDEQLGIQAQRPSEKNIDSASQCEEADVWFSSYCKETSISASEGNVVLLSEDLENADDQSVTSQPQHNSDFYFRSHEFQYIATVEEETSGDAATPGDWQAKVSQLNQEIDTKSESQSTMAATIRQLLAEKSELERRIQERESDPQYAVTLSKEEYNTKMKLLQEEFDKEVQEKTRVMSDSKSLSTSLEDLRDQLIDVRRRIDEIQGLSRYNSSDQRQAEKEVGATASSQRHTQEKSVMEYDMN